MSMLRYLVDCLLRSRGWVAPVVLFWPLVIIVASPAPADPDGATVCLAAAIPAAAWMAMSTLRSETVGQEYVTAAAVGSVARVRMAKVAVAFLAMAVQAFAAALALGMLGCWPVVRSLAFLGSLVALSWCGGAIGALVGSVARGNVLIKVVLVAAVSLVLLRLPGPASRLIAALATADLAATLGWIGATVSLGIVSLLVSRVIWLRS